MPFSPCASSRCLESTYKELKLGIDLALKAAEERRLESTYKELKPQKENEQLIKKYTFRVYL